MATADWKMRRHVCQAFFLPVNANRAHVSRLQQCMVPKQIHTLDSTSPGDCSLLKEYTRNLRQDSKERSKCQPVRQHAKFESENSNQPTRPPSLSKARGLGRKPHFGGKEKRKFQLSRRADLSVSQLKFEIVLALKFWRVKY